jgi:hypothetical protein
LDVQDTDAVVKADRTLTLFMVNTIADNACKFTSEGGHVLIVGKETKEYVEVSITDTGKGMTHEEVAHVFDRTYTGGHGYGLLNCKGIIEKYKKISSIFQICDIRCESDLGKGSRFSFRLPIGIRKVKSSNAISSPLKGLLLFLFLLPLKTYAQIGNAVYYADKVYHCNITAHYDSTLIYADSALAVIKVTPLKNENDSSMCNNVLLSIYNERAVAALALHKWKLYHANNDAYTALFNNLSADKTLGSYVRTMQQSENNKNVAIVILILLFVLIFPVYYFLYYRHLLYNRYCVERINGINQVLLSDKTDDEKLAFISRLWDERMGERNNLRQSSLISQLSDIVEQIKNALSKSISVYRDLQTNIELAQDELERTLYENGKLHISNAVLDNCLSTLKHETMYYPSRIAQLIDGSDSNLESISELVNYYKELYAMLSAQAMLQVNSVKFKLNIELRDYLFELLAKACGKKKVEYTIKEKNETYVTITVTMAGLQLTDIEIQRFFTPLTSNLDMMLCRQIVREIGEMTNMRGCGILALRDAEGQINVEIILSKKICKILKLS